MTLVSNPSIFRTPGPQIGGGIASGQIGTLGANGNISDLAGFGPNPPAISAIRTQGATLIDVSTLSPTISQHWQIISVTFQIYLGLLVCATVNAVHPFSWGSTRGLSAKFGRVVAGVLFGSDVQQTNGPPSGTTPGWYSTPMSALPLDAELTTPMFDPGLSDVPPLALPADPGSPSPVVGQLLSLEGVISVPIPRPVIPGSSTQIGVGIWMLPSIYVLTPNVAAGITSAIVGLCACYSSYTINYDNGVQLNAR